MDGKVGKGKWAKQTSIELLLLLSAVLLFALSFPNILNKWGFSFLAYFSLIPVFILIHRCGFFKSMVYGALYGYLSYSLFNYWLAIFDPNAFLIVPLIYMSYFIIVFPILKLADKLFPKHGYILQVLIWLSYEYFRTKGFLGYSYGVLGYSQYNFTALIGIADLVGVAGVSFLIVLPSAIIGHVFCENRNSFKKQYRNYIWPMSIWILLFSSSIFYSTLAKVDYSKSPVLRTAIVQHNIDSWRKGIDTFKTALDALIRITDESIEKNPDLIIWSETAFVPAIEYHLKYRENREKVELIRKLMNYLESLDTPLILGNNDTIKIGNKIESYNAILQFEGSYIKDAYRKMHLVPFSEYFPYGEILPRLNDLILSTGASYYNKGAEYTIFDHDGIKLGGQICFEDTFAYISRESVKKGAQVLVNLTNDSWSLEPVAGIQHMGMAVFRSIENRRSMVRSTNGGYTTVIDPNGVRIAELEPLTEGSLVENVPVYTERTTLFTRWGNWLDHLIIIVTIGGLLMGIIFQLMKSHEIKKW